MIFDSVNFESQGFGSIRICMPFDSVVARESNAIRSMTMIAAARTKASKNQI